MPAETDAATGEITDFGESQFPMDSGRARLLPSRLLGQFGGSAGASPSQINNHPQIHPAATSSRFIPI
jgi:hypothetical protein